LTDKKAIDKKESLPLLQHFALEEEDFDLFHIATTDEWNGGCCRGVGGWDSRYLALKRERGPVPRLLSEGRALVPLTS